MTDDAADDGLRLTRSALAAESPLTSDDALESWLRERAVAHDFDVTLSALSELDGWFFEPEYGDLVHRSGRFFSIEGLRVNVGESGWDQPIINQPETGILGILVKEFDGVLHCLMQAKMEPGNVNVIQLSPTVQATHSNYTGVHGGQPTPYVEYFRAPRPGRVLVDTLQSEQGSWFLRKRNRNIVVETTEDVPEHEDYRWLTLGQVLRLLTVDNAVNMDARTVLSCMPFAAPPESGTEDGYRAALRRSIDHAPGRHSTQEVLGLLTEQRVVQRHVQRRIPLGQVAGWDCSDKEITHEDGRYFRIVGAHVKAANREVGRWSQPLLEPRGPEVSAFLTKEFDGVLHLLARARTEAGSLAGAELAPTVQCSPGDLRGLSSPPYLEEVLAATGDRVRYDSMQSEEGGRFYHAQNRYLIVEAGEDTPADAPDGFLWITVGQAMDLLKHSNYLNVQARSLIAALHTTW
ncbi:NDP-hexose 2,3-dehydratase family protein [Streptomyces sp. PTD9-10]|uniref:NDP-hexose 2,3-dehydratase family protein n=1 Tax=Streptomyces sp. PTD9-10 TaxID=3120151 RepID=UPI00300AD5AC